MRRWLLAAAVNGFLAVAAGAVGSHLLDRVTGEADLQLFATANRFHMWHALALIGVAMAASRPRAGRAADMAGRLFITGIGLFCGSLYAMGAGASRDWAVLAPVGGAAFLAGWIALAIAAWRGGRI